MTIELLREMLGWCVLINFGLLLWWFGFLVFAHDFTFRLHSAWFDLTVNQFDAIHYQAMAYFKLAVFILNLVPWIALHIVT